MRVVRCMQPMILGSCSSPAAAPLRRRASRLSTSRWRFFSASVLIAVFVQ